MTEMLYKAQRSDAERAALYDELCGAALECQRCGLCKTRQHVVIGEGDIASRIMFVGEGPGEVEDRTGRPFVGPAGELLTAILDAAGFKRDQVYITNIVKCRPPKNRVPEIEEVISCQGWLEAQLALLRPQIIVCLGNTPLKWFIHSTEGITKMRGRWFSWRGAALMPMFHPSYLLRSESRTKNSPKYLTWQDIQQIRSRYESLRKGQ